MNVSTPSIPALPPGYMSFLLCFHNIASASPRMTNAYLNGQPVGQIVDGAFKPHGLALADGSKRPLTFREVGDPCPFATLEALKAALHAAVEAIELPEPATSETTRL